MRGWIDSEEWVEAEHAGPDPSEIPCVPGTVTTIVFGALPPGLEIGCVVAGSCVSTWWWTPWEERWLPTREEMDGSVRLMDSWEWHSLPVEVIP